MTQKSYSIAHAESSLGWGGQEIRIYTEMLAMRNRGHRLWLFAPAQSTIYARCREAGFPVFPFSVHKACYPLTVLRLAAAFRKEKVQVVNPHSSRDGWLVGMAARLARVPLVIRSRHFDVDYPNRFLSRIAFCRLPHHVLTTSQRMAERLHLELGLDRDRITCLPTGIDMEKFHPQVQGQLRRELGLPLEMTLIGMIAVLRMRKGHLQFLDAAAQLLKTNDSLHFVIAGDGGGREMLMQRIHQLGLQKRVSWLGYREDVPNILASLDILVLPSTADEGIPQAILQAHAMGKSVVGTNVEGIKEVIRDGETGLLAVPGQSESLAEKIGLLARDPLLRQTLGNRGREKSSNHSLTRMCEQLEDVYSRYLNPK